MTNTSLFTENGRKYLIPGELRRFDKASASCEESDKLLFATLYLSGCRISEALKLNGSSFDFDTNSVWFRTLKRRDGKVEYRQLSMPPWFMEAAWRFLKRNDIEQTDKVWSIHRTTAWRHIKKIMNAAGVSGDQATCKGFRHAVGVQARKKGLDIAALQDWFGHSSVKNTMIYQQIVFEERRRFANKLHSESQLKFGIN